MKHRGALRLGLVLGLLACTAAQAQPRTISLDPRFTRLGFELSTRWGQTLQGSFPRYDGLVNVMPDGRHQVSLRMYTADVQIADHARYARWARGRAFFDADKWPDVIFVSYPYSTGVLHDGGQIQGELVIRGVHRPETLTVEPSACARPAQDCDVVLRGDIKRSDYGMDNLMLAISDQVVFVLRARVQPQEARP